MKLKVLPVSGKVGNGPKWVRSESCPTMVPDNRRRKKRSGLPIGANLRPP